MKTVKLSLFLKQEMKKPKLAKLIRAHMDAYIELSRFSPIREIMKIIKERKNNEFKE